MRLLLDTHVWLWLVTDTSKLPDSYSAAIADVKNDLFVSVASLWELSIKQRLGKLTTALSLAEFVRRGLNGVEVVSVRVEHVTQLHDLPMIHRDPFDRMLVAQAIREGLTLLTIDSVLRQYGVPILDTANP